MGRQQNRSRWTRLLGIVGMAAAVWSAGEATARAEDADLAPGTLLVADRRLKDPNFLKAIILVVAYDEHGAVGLVINRPGEVPISQLLAGVKEARERKDTAFSGGPVEPKSVLALLRGSKAPDGAQRIVGDVWAIPDEDSVQETLAMHPGPDKLRFYLGYAGWGPGQLETELDAGAWRVIPAKGDTVFDQEPESLWDRVVRSLDMRLARFLLPQTVQ